MQLKFELCAEKKIKNKFKPHKKIIKLSGSSIIKAIRSPFQGRSPFFPIFLGPKVSQNCDIKSKQLHTKMELTWKLGKGRNFSVAPSARYNLAGMKQNGFSAQLSTARGLQKVSRAFGKQPNSYRQISDIAVKYLQKLLHFEGFHRIKLRHC